MSSSRRAWIVTVLGCAAISLATTMPACGSTPAEEPAPAGGGDASVAAPDAAVPDAPPPDGDAAAPDVVTGDIVGLLRVPELLGRPTAASVALNLVASEALDGYVEYGATPGVFDKRTSARSLVADEPAVFALDGLAADQAYTYRARLRRPAETGFRAGAERRFHTQRAAGSTFRFTVQADSHLDGNSVLDQYVRTLGNVLADAPDFHVDLGDTFMCEKFSTPLTNTVSPCPDAASVNARYVYERGNFGLVSHSVPLFLVNGNHDGELGFSPLVAGQGVPIWATLARHRYFLNPTPDAFYGGDTFVEPTVGQRASWYSWRWGDALFIALDPFWDTKAKPSAADAWGWTLGERQYQWLAQTLGASTAKYKFVFLHNLVGGLDGQMRGGVEAAPYYEWGGLDADGTPGLADRRPGWPKSIHELLVAAKVTAVFHGHDHVYVHQELDGVAYQEVPQPSAKNTTNGQAIALSYHYESGTVVSSAGHVRVTVAPSQVTVDYVRSWLPANETAGRKNGEIADSYTVSPP
ncbi:MAG: metallophosphoesterase [Deltaproteobacteria bacterium]|nr:metallophosphoesterase [Deltaproteobacteria bacterium]